MSAGGEGRDFHRNTSLHNLLEKRPKGPGNNNGSGNSKPWERSQSELALENHDAGQFLSKSTTRDYTTEDGRSGQVSEQSKVYWDLSKADDEEGAPGRQGKLKISLQTIRQKEELQTSSSSEMSSNSTSVKTQSYVRRMSSETSLKREYSPDFDLTMIDTSSAPALKIEDVDEEVEAVVESPIKSKSAPDLSTIVTNSQPSLAATLTKAVPILQDNIKRLKSESRTEKCSSLNDMLELIEKAWATPQIGYDLAYGLCDVLRTEGGLEILVENCSNLDYKIRLGSAKVLEQSMTTSNRDVVAKKGLGIIVKMSQAAKDDLALSRASAGILESLFKHSEETCAKVIKLGGLKSLLYSCRSFDKLSLRHVAQALANLAIYGGTDSQYEMMVHKAPEWLFPLAFTNDDSIRYYACLAITTLSANKEIESAVVKSGTLDLVQPFIMSHDPAEFGHSDIAHLHGHSRDWLMRLVPLLLSKREEAQNLAAFHFAMEAGIKVAQGRKELFTEIGAVEPLKRVASSTNKLASKFAIQALRIIGEEVPHRLHLQVPAWSVQDVEYWLKQVGFQETATLFKESQVDGDLLLTLTEQELKDDLSIANGICRKRFLRELKRLKVTADYSSCDPTKLDEWLLELGADYSQYTYQMLQSGVDKRMLRYVNELHLRDDCGILNGVHRIKILEAARRLSSAAGTPADGPDGPLDKSLDVFISYRRSNGSQLASLLKVHLQLRGFTVFLDIEKLRAGKFDDNLLNSVRNARHFILVLTPNSLDRCIGDKEHKDWVHREVVAAIEGGCNIIPVMDNFQFPPPEQLPEDMRPLCFFNGIRWVHDYQDACVEKIIEFLHVGNYAPPMNMSPASSMVSDNSG